LPLGNSERKRTMLGVGVPVASSRLDPHDEDTGQYVPEAIPGESLSALIARCAQQSHPDTANSASPTAPVAMPAEPQTAAQPKSLQAAAIAPEGGSSGVRPRAASFHTVPQFPEDSLSGHPVEAESNFHQVGADRITDALTSDSAHEAAHEWREVVYLRVGVSSHPPEIDAAMIAHRPRSRRRLWFARFLFVFVALGVALLIATEVSIYARLPWLDPRPLLVKGAKLAKEKIPWERIPKMIRR
jgi:hypothetical protein